MTDQILTALLKVADDLVLATIEWRDARQAIFDNQFDISDASKARWTRLANAENALMACARLMPEPGS